MLLTLQISALHLWPFFHPFNKYLFFLMSIHDHCLLLVYHVHKIVGSNDNLLLMNYQYF